MRALTTRGRATVLLGALLVVAGLAWHYPLVAGLGGALLVVVLAGHTPGSVVHDVLETVSPPQPDEG